MRGLAAAAEAGLAAAEAAEAAQRWAEAREVRQQALQPGAAAAAGAIPSFPRLPVEEREKADDHRAVQRAKLKRQRPDNRSYGWILLCSMEFAGS